jgi:hypothetical protein
MTGEQADQIVVSSVRANRRTKARLVFSVSSPRVFEILSEFVVRQAVGNLKAESITAQ